MIEIKTAICSYGMSGQVFHGPCLKVSPEFKVLKILERSKQISQKDFPEATIVRNYSAILDDPEIELVIINTPDEFHYEMGKKALLAGKHIILEKPFTKYSWQAIELITLAKKQELMISVFQNRRWDGNFLTIQKIIEKNILGRIVETELHFDRFRPVIDKKNWKEQADERNGVLFNLGAHLVDQALVLFGSPISVTAKLDILRDKGKVTDYFNLRLDYPKHTVILKSSYLAREQSPQIILHGTKGSFLKHGIDPQEELLKKGELPNGIHWGKEDEHYWGRLNTSHKELHFTGTLETEAGNYPLYYKNIALHLREKQELQVKPEEALKVILILEKAIESNKKGKTILF